MALLDQRNDNTIKYLVDALNKDVLRVNTLATRSGLAALEAQEGVENALTVIGTVYENLGGLIEALPDRLSSRYRAEWLADIENGDGEVVGTKSLYTAQSELSQTASAIRTDFEQADTDYQNYVHTYIQFDANGITLGEIGSPLKLVITNERIEIWNMDFSQDEPITYWDTHILHTPKALEVPTGGNFTIGQFRWVPRSGQNGQPGNLSLVKV